MQIENFDSVRKAYSQSRSVGTTNYRYEISPEDREKFDAAAAAIIRMRATFDDWITIGHAIIAARTYADRLGGRKAFQDILAEQRIMPPLDKAEMSRLEKVMAHLAEVQQWRETLAENQQIAWASPKSIINRCPAGTAARNSPPEADTPGIHVGGKRRAQGRSRKLPPRRRLRFQSASEIGAMSTDAPRMVPVMAGQTCGAS
jgi:hypothetical protein